MGDRDAEHTLTELQEARAEVDRLRDLLRRRDSYLMERLVKLEDLLRWRDAHTEPPTIEDRYIVATCRNNIGSWSDNYWENGRWEIKPVDYWRPIGPLPDERGE